MLSKLKMPTSLIHDLLVPLILFVLVFFCLSEDFVFETSERVFDEFLNIKDEICHHSQEVLRHVAHLLCPALTSG